MRGLDMSTTQRWPYSVKQRAQAAGQRQCNPTCGMRGYSLIEVTVTVSIVAIMIAIAMPMWKANRMNVLTARKMVLANLRLARANAITKSIHYQVSFPDAGHVTLSRMFQSPAGSGTWVVDTTKVQTSALPANTQVAADSLSTTVQFNSRGIVANTSTMTAIRLTDSFGNTQSLQVWPSGQMNET
jgi:prepilin-type N-terminal cleavage/methylation domain-containing protein